MKSSYPISINVNVFTDCTRCVWVHACVRVHVCVCSYFMSSKDFQTHFALCTHWHWLSCQGTSCFQKNFFDGGTVKRIQALKKTLVQIPDLTSPTLVIHPLWASLSPLGTWGSWCQGQICSNVLGFCTSNCENPRLQVVPFCILLLLVFSLKTIISKPLVATTPS